MDLGSFLHLLVIVAILVAIVAVILAALGFFTAQAHRKSQKSAIMTYLLKLGRAPSLNRLHSRLYYPWREENWVLNRAGRRAHRHKRRQQ